MILEAFLEARSRAAFKEARKVSLKDDALALVGCGLALKESLKDSGFIRM